MFDELDDSETFIPTHSFRASVLHRGRSRRRRRVAFAVGGATAAAVVAVPAAYAYYEYRRLHDIHHIAIEGLHDDFPIEPAASDVPGPPITSAVATSSPVPIVDESTAGTGGGTEAPTTVAAPPELHEATTFLVIGVDTRPDLNLGTRSDTIMLLRVDPAANALRLLSIPRDLYVQSRGTRINSLLDDKDPSDLVAVIENTFTVSIDHVVQVDFDGFSDLVDLAGGVDVEAALPMRDAHTGLSLPGGTCTHLDGDAALALVRSRHTQFYENGVWKEDPRSDFGRIDRQQFVMRALARGVLDELDDPVSIHDFVSIAIDSLVVDDGLTPEQMVSTAWTVRGIGIDALQTATVQSQPQVIGGAAVLAPSAADVQAAGAFVRNGTPLSSSTGPAGASNNADTSGSPTPYELTAC